MNEAQLKSRIMALKVVMKDLQKFWYYEREIGDDMLNDDYPFEKSFVDVVSDIDTWCDTILSKL